MRKEWLATEDEALLDKVIVELTRSSGTQSMRSWLTELRSSMNSSLYWVCNLAHSSSKTN